MSLVTAWKPEPDVVLHQALGKLAEECAELAQIATRCMIQGYAEFNPSTDKLNRTHLMEEIADVKASMRWLFDVLDEPFKGESKREFCKREVLRRWEAMLRADTDLPPHTLFERTRGAFEAAVIERLKESGFTEIEIRTEALMRCGEGYQDEVINSGWHYWNAANTAKVAAA